MKINNDNKNNNILIIGYCGLEDGFLGGGKALNKIGYNIFFFPYLSYIMDNNLEVNNILKSEITSKNIDICLWWNNSIKYDDIKNIIDSSSNIKNITYNWDAFIYDYKKYDESTIKIWEKIIINNNNKYPLMNHVFSCFEKEILYNNNNNNNISISYLPPGFDKDISYYYKDEKYECDISIVCTNLYDDIEQFPDLSTNITRYEIVNKIYQNRNNINFHIYGPDKFKDIFPECYKGFIKYNDCYKVFSNSKINLSIHPIINELNEKISNAEYFSERVPQILGCKGLLVTNSYFSDKFKNNIDYINIDNNIDWYQKLLNILENSNSYDHIRESGYKTVCKYYQWNNWANILDQKIKDINK